MSWSFISHVTQHISKPRLGEQKNPTQWPSEATAVIKNEYDEEVVVGKCRRQAFFRLMLDSYAFDSQKYGFYQPLVENIQLLSIPTDPYLRWIWKAGELYEDMQIDLAKRSGVYVADQVAIYVPSHNVSGKIDLVAVNPETSKLKALEFKSVYGFNANSVLGTPAERKRGKMGTPKESHLMQIGIYDFWYASNDERFESSSLIYGARDTGRFSEYSIFTEEDEETGLHPISYQGLSPVPTGRVTTQITMENVFENYKYVAACVDGGTIPDRDFDAQYSDEKIETLYERGELNKTDTAQHEKRKKQIAEGKTRIVKKVKKGDWQCRFCNYKDICYDSESNPREV